MWALNDYEYIVALAGLAYMTDDECNEVGYDDSGNSLYGDIQPLAGGYIQMGLYTDAGCTQLADTSYTYDDFYAGGDGMNLGSGDGDGGGYNDDNFYNQAYEWWTDSQEYTLMNMNKVYHDYKFCTSCIDYPTYQDGYFIGDDGTDEDDLINQCWKFYSHDNYNCDADCIAMGAAQGSITWVGYNGKQFGTLISGQYSSEGDRGEGAAEGSGGAARIERLKANLFLTFAGIVFVATFLAFAVARGSSKKKKSSRSRSRRLLDADYVGGSDGRRARSGSRSQSRARRSGGEKSVRSSRSKSKGRSSSGKSSSAKSASRSKSRSRREGYEAPKASGTSEKKSSSEMKRSGSRSRKSPTEPSSSRRRERTDDEQ